MPSDPERHPRAFDSLRRQVTPTDEKGGIFPEMDDDAFNAYIDSKQDFESKGATKRQGITKEDVISALVLGSPIAIAFLYAIAPHFR